MVVGNSSILDNRKYVIGGIAFVIVVAYIIRLAFLQLFSSDYKASASIGMNIPRAKARAGTPQRVRMMARAAPMP